MGNEEDPDKHGRPLRLPAEAQVRIGQKLRGYYGKVVAEPVPDRFRELLDALGAAQPSEE